MKKCLSLLLAVTMLFSLVLAYADGEDLAAEGQPAAEEYFSETEFEPVYAFEPATDVVPDEQPVVEPDADVNLAPQFEPNSEADVALEPQDTDASEDNAAPVQQPALTAEAGVELDDASDLEAEAEQEDATESDASVPEMEVVSDPVEIIPAQPAEADQEGVSFIDSEEAAVEADPEDINSYVIPSVEVTAPVEVPSVTARIRVRGETFIGGETILKVELFGDDPVDIFWRVSEDPTAEEPIWYDFPYAAYEDTYTFVLTEEMAALAWRVELSNGFVSSYIYIPVTEPLTPVRREETRPTEPVVETVSQPAENPIEPVKAEKEASEAIDEEADSELETIVRTTVRVINEDPAEEEDVSTSEEDAATEKATAVVVATVVKTEASEEETADEAVDEEWQAVTEEDETVASDEEEETEIVEAEESDVGDEDAEVEDAEESEKTEAAAAEDADESESDSEEAETVDVEESDEDTEAETTVEEEKTAEETVEDEDAQAESEKQDTAADEPAEAAEGEKPSDGRDEHKESVEAETEAEEESIEKDPEEKTEEPAEDATLEASFSCEYEAPYYFEDEILLTAVSNQEEAEIIWQIASDGEEWIDLGEGETFSLILNADNANSAFRALIRTEDAEIVSNMIAPFEATEYLADWVQITMSGNEAPVYGDVVHFHADYFTLSADPHIVWEASRDGAEWTKLDQEGTDISIIVSEATDGIQIRAKLLTADTITD
ncbi:MAG: hypothetical protein IJ153_00010 [Clostridia bacterium]|nr:hypothetical protein [Clostridia bacterium]